MNSSILSKRAQMYRELNQRQNIPDVAWIGFMVDLLHVVHTGKILAQATYHYDDETGSLEESADTLSRLDVSTLSYCGVVHDAYAMGYQRLSDMLKHLLPEQYESITNVLAETNHWDLSSPTLTTTLLNCCSQSLYHLREQVKTQWGCSNCWPEEDYVD